MHVIAKYEQRVAQADSLLCVGLDSAIERIPAPYARESTPQFAWNRHIIEQTHAFVSAYKPNSAFYEARGAQGLHELQLTLEYLRAEHPDIVTIYDAKRGDNATSNQGYAKAVFDHYGFDAVTLQPYMGREVLEPFLERSDKGCIILCRTSNLGPGPQLLRVQDERYAEQPLWRWVAQQVRDEWNSRGNCMLVVGATHPDVLAEVRSLVGTMPILAPGIGEQGGDLQRAVEAGIDAHGRGIFLSASRSVMFSEDPARKARELRDAINRFRAAQRPASA